MSNIYQEWERLLRVSIKMAHFTGTKHYVWWDEYTRQWVATTKTRREYTRERMRRHNEEENA